MSHEKSQLTGLDCVGVNMASDFNTLGVYLCMIMRVSELLGSKGAVNPRAGYIC